MNTNQLLAAVNKSIDDDHLLIEYPTLDQLEAGAYTFYLDEDSVKNTKDIGRDCFSPWTGKGINGLKQTKSYSKAVSRRGDGEFEVNAAGEFQLKSLKNIHTHKPQLIRNIAFVVSERGELMTHVFHHYSAKSFVEGNEKKQRILPSVSHCIKQSVEYRTTVQAKKKLFDSGLIVDSKQIASLSRSCPNHVKTKQGRIPATDAYKIYDRFLKKSFIHEEILEQPYINTEDDGLIVFRALVAFPAAIRYFSVGLPPFEDLAEYQAQVENMMLGTDSYIESLSDHYFRSSNASGAYPMIGAHIQIDTTFSLSSAEYVTFIVGVSDTLLHADSQKSSSIILAYMIHSHRRAEDHTQFSQFLKKLFQEHCPGKSPGAVIHDGEKTFNCYDEVFLKATSLRCDVHRLDNIKHVIKANGNLIDPEYVQQQLYGVKQRGGTGHFLVSGILNKLTFERFHSKMEVLMQESPVGLKEWLMQNEQSLFRQNSFASKISAGLLVQYATTNVIEEKNAYIKQLITCKLPGEKLMDSLLHFHRKEIGERLLSVTGRSKKFSGLNIKTALEYRLMSIPEQKLFLSSYGLSDLTLGNNLHQFPEWAISDDKMTREQLVHTVFNLKCFDTTQGNIFFLTRPDIETELVVLKRIDSDLRASLFEKLESVRDDETSMQIMRLQMRPERGSKFRVRKGKQMSKGNGPRCLAGF